MAAAQPELPTGFTFSPRELDLTDVYLRRKIAGQALPVGAGFIHDGDVYSAEPENLVKGRSHAPCTGAEGHNDKQGVWYYFSPVRYAGRKNARGGGGRKSRTVAGDSSKRWHPESAPKPVKGGSAVGGYEQKFSYMVKDAASRKDKRAGWIMAEYGISPEYGGGDLVLCKTYPSTRSAPCASSTTTSSATTVAVPVSESESESSSSSKKRKAAGDHPEAPKPCAPRQMDYQDGRPPLPESLEPALTSEDAGDHHHHHHTADEAPPPFSISELFDADDAIEFHRLCRGLLKNEGTTAALPIVIDDDQDMDWFGGDLGAPIAEVERDAAVGPVDHHPEEVRPCGFWLQMEEEFESLYKDVVLVSKNDDTLATEKEGDLTAPPCAPAAQPEEEEEDAATGNDNQIASWGEEGAQSDEPAPDEVIYGLPCPASSPEMIRTCGDDVMLWPSPSSLSLPLLGM